MLESSNEQISSAPFFDLHHTTQSPCIVLASSSQLSFSCSDHDRLFHITTVAPSFPPQKSRSPRPADRKKGGADIAASFSILMTILICCSARNTAHVGDLHPASSNSTVCFVSFRIVVISACSWPSQHSYFCRKFHPPLLIVHPCPGSRHVVRPSILMIFVSSTCSSHTCDESWILPVTKLPAGISWSRNPLSLVVFLAHEGGQGHMQLLASRALPTACFYAWTPNLSCQLGC